MSEVAAPRPSPPAPVGHSLAAWRERVRRWLVERYSGQARAERDDAERRLGLLFERSGEGLVICDGRGHIVTCNPVAGQLFGASPDALRGAALAGRIVQDLPPGAAPALRSGEAEARRADGTRVPVDMRVSELPGAAPRQLLVQLNDTSDRRQAQDRLTRLANYDSLTGLPNRALFRDRLAGAMERARRSGKPLALMFLDLDRFKIINDSLGHEAGDRLLLHVAKTLSSCLRGTDSLARTGDHDRYTVSRLGGDEFTVIAEDAGGPDDAALIAQRLLDALAVPFHTGQDEVIISASVGITAYPTDDVDLDTLVRHTDMAMYRAKSLGRGMYCFFSEDLNAAVSARLSLESSLRRAIDNREFLLHYQPKADLRTGEIVGVEALLRWHAPGRGMVPPDRFIAVLEETGLILPVGAWVIRTALAQLAAWDRAGLPPLTLAVNLSARQFRHQYLAAMVGDTLRETGIDASRLEIELTESLLMEDNETTRAMLTNFKHLGLRLALDDFGTGHSSLAYLRRFHLHTLKIDRSFVNALPHNQEDLAIARAIIALGRSMSMSVVAEGVETQQQADVLRELGCDEIQGYLLSRPLPAEELERWLGARVRDSEQAHLAYVRGQLEVQRIDIELGEPEGEPPAVLGAPAAPGEDGEGEGASLAIRACTGAYEGAGAAAGPAAGARAAWRITESPGIQTWALGRSLESSDARARRARQQRGRAPDTDCDDRGARDERLERDGRERPPAARPESGAAGRGDAAAAAGADPGRRRLRQDPGADDAHCLAAFEPPGEPRPGVRRDLHEQGRQGDARPPVGDAADPRAGHVDRHLPRPGQPLPARALEARRPAPDLPDT